MTKELGIHPIIGVKCFNDGSEIIFKLLEGNKGGMNI